MIQGFDVHLKRKTIKKKVEKSMQRYL